MSVNVTKTKLPGVVLMEPRVFSDERGFFFESFNETSFKEATGLDYNFVQDNHSKSDRGVLRGLHYQIEQAQGKLVRVVEGAVFDVVVDIRVGSSSFGKWYGITLSEENKKQIWVPPGFAHGFLVTSNSAQVLYKTTDYYAPMYERSIRWDDPDLNIDWPQMRGSYILSAKDTAAFSLRDAELPIY